jgi:hypothetical protein
MMFILWACARASGLAHKVPESFTFVGQKSLLGVPTSSFSPASWDHYMYRNIFGRRIWPRAQHCAAHLSGIATDRWSSRPTSCRGPSPPWRRSRPPAGRRGDGDDWLIISFAVAIIGGTGLSRDHLRPSILMGSPSHADQARTGRSQSQPLLRQLLPRPAHPPGDRGRRVREISDNGQRRGEDLATYAPQVPRTSAAGLRPCPRSGGLGRRTVRPANISSS